MKLKQNAVCGTLVEPCQRQVLLVGKAGLSAPLHCWDLEEESCAQNAGVIGYLKTIRTRFPR